jgi:hypothetical protein
MSEQPQSTLGRPLLERRGLTADGVFSRGGIKGLAFAGGIAAAEEAGYSYWHELAGTSASSGRSRTSSKATTGALPLHTYPVEVRDGAIWLDG